MMSELMCPRCGSHEFEPWYEQTLLAGPTNYYTYTCAQCKNQVEVKRTIPSSQKVVLGEEDQIVTGWWSE